MGERVRRATLCVGAALLVLGGCSGDDDGTDDDSSVITDPVETSETTGTTSTSSSTSTTADPEAGVKAEVEEAYVDHWDVYLEILSDPHPASPLVDEHYTGPSREAMLDGISTMILDGLHLEAPDDPANFSVEVRSSSVDGSTAHLDACVVDGLVQIDNETGDVVNAAVVTVVYDAEMQLEGGQWKLARHEIVSKSDGATCGD